MANLLEVLHILHKRDNNSCPTRLTAQPLLPCKYKRGVDEIISPKDSDVKPKYVFFSVLSANCPICGHARAVRWPNGNARASRLKPRSKASARVPAIYATPVALAGMPRLPKPLLQVVARPYAVTA